MKIGVITFHYNLNCGAILQAYALQTHLEKMGHSVEFIDYRPKQKFSIKRHLSKSPAILLDKWKNLFQELIYERKKDYNYVIKQTPVRYFTIDDLRKNPPQCDVYICGSDQIWNIEKKKTLPYAYLLDFGNSSIPRISYAASMNNAIIPDVLKTELQNILGKFKVISVREKKAVEVLSNLLSGIKTVNHIQDPTLLLKGEEYLKISSPIQKEKGFAVSYILSQLSDNQIFQLKEFAKKVNLELINIRNPSTCIRLSGEENVIVTPYKWLSFVSSSEFVICGSFHAVVFSLLFHKQFVVLLSLNDDGTPRPNERIQSILSSVGLQDRCLGYFSSDDIVRLKEEKIDWDFVDDWIREKRDEGDNFLLNALK